MEKLAVALLIVMQIKFLLLRLKYNTDTQFLMSFILLLFLLHLQPYKNPKPLHPLKLNKKTKRTK